MTAYLEPSKEIPISFDVDVVVAGGGVAGIVAATAAARNGAKTLLIERNGVLGGVATAGLMVAFGGHFYDARNENVICGIPKEFVQRIIDRGGAPANSLSPNIDERPMKIVFDPEIFKRCAVEMLTEAGVEVLLHTMVADVIRDGSDLRGLIIENKSGRQAVMTKSVVDCTGEMDVANRADAPHRVVNRNEVCNSIMYTVGGIDWQELYDFVAQHSADIVDAHFDMFHWERIEHQWKVGYAAMGSWGICHPGAWQPFMNIIQDAIDKGLWQTEHFNWGREPGRDLGEGDPVTDWCFDMQGLEGWPEKDVCDLWGACTVTTIGTDALNVSRFELFGLEMIWKYFENVVQKIPGFGNSHVINIATDLGVRSARHMETRDTVTPEDRIAGTRFDTVVGRGTTYNTMQTSFKPDDAPSGAALRDGVRGFDIPYGMLLPKEVENLLIAGRAFTILRGMPLCMVTGQAAGTAAALASQNGLRPSEVNISELQAKLRKDGVNLG